jgi:predicted deacylase
MYPYEEISSVEKHVFMKTIYLEAEEDGVWYCNVAANETVKQGQLLGRMEDFFGNVLHKYYAEADGIVFYHCCGLSVKTGRNLVAYGVEEE